MTNASNKDAEQTQEAAPTAPPGWYSNAEGEQQWWDGAGWAAPVSEVAPETTSPAPPRKHSTWLRDLLIVLVIVVGGFILLKSFGQDETNSSASEEQSSDISAATPPMPTKSAEQLRDEFYESEGFQVVESGAHYFRWFTADEKAESSCGYTRCSWGVIHSVKGCSTGFYIQADLLSGGTKYDWTNTKTPSASPDETITFTLEDYRGAAESFSISEITCTDY